MVGGVLDDVHGPGAVLNLDYLRPWDIPGVRVYFPVQRSADEDGARRGCVVLAREGPFGDVLHAMESLRAWNET